MQWAGSKSWWTGTLYNITSPKCCLLTLFSKVDSAILHGAIGMVVGADSLYFEACQPWKKISHITTSSYAQGEQEVAS